MKKIYFLLALFSSVLLHSQERYFLNSDTRLYTSPNTSSSFLGYFKYGAEIRLLSGSQNRWYKVQADNFNEGYVQEKFVITQLNAKDVKIKDLENPILEGGDAYYGGNHLFVLAAGLKAAGITILGTSPDAINLAEERGAFGGVLESVNLTAPEFGMASSQMQAIEIAHRIGYPVLVRPSFVLGGRGMEIVYDDESLAGFISRATDITPDHPVLVDRFLDSAIEIDVDALYDGTELYLGGVMEHIEEAGIHSGDSACSLPPYTLGPAEIERIRTSTLGIAKGVGVRGLLNVQYALTNGILYVLEANPRASRTVPFVSKATGGSS